MPNDGILMLEQNLQELQQEGLLDLSDLVMKPILKMCFQRGCATVEGLPAGWPPH